MGLSRPAGRLPEVLFVCVHNAGRSQMAAGLLRHLGTGRVTVRSAGSAPADELNPAVVEAMREVGIEIGAERPTLLHEQLVREADWVVTMGCGDACPIYPGRRYLDWELPDPAGATLEEVRLLRSEVEQRVLRLLEEFPAATT